MEKMSVIEKAIQWAVGIAADNTHGYDQIHRWGPDYDCSSLVISSYRAAGLELKGATYTGNMRAAFIKNGFKSIPYKKGMSLFRGDVLLNEKHHTALYIGDGKIVQASINEKGKITGGKTGDQTGGEIAVRRFYEYKHGWDCILRFVAAEPDNTRYIEMEVPRLTKGMRRAEVGTVQVLLNALGYAGKNGRPLKIDCDYGANTEYAVSLFQASKGLPSDGICGKLTWPALISSNYR
jgi:hypothetical protein